MTYIAVDTWGTLAENCSKYLHKGRGVRVVGRLRQDRWQDEEDKLHERFVVVAEHVEFQSDPSRKQEQKGEQTDQQEQADTEIVFEKSP